MSSLRNAIPKRTYRERGQLSWRKHLGPLEKHKDYVRRARDRHRKEKEINHLQEQAFFRNPDEYSAEMTHYERDKEGNLVFEVTNAVSNSALKSQYEKDISVLNMQRQKFINKINRLEKQLSTASVAKAKHKVFVDNENDANSFDPSEYFNTPKELGKRTFNRPSKEYLETQEIPTVSNRTVQQKQKKISKLKQKIKVIDKALKKLEGKRDLVNNKTEVIENDNDNEDEDNENNNESKNRYKQKGRKK
eukprot:gb/GECH01014861.1/.p1 GENE.gb/GECH01014861.1/~~gb/GECH01014861.1/.p1  ORF type:complete len:248 (+),score=82.33 gb/GECH01014861.1/:1-744(+)